MCLRLRRSIVVESRAAYVSVAHRISSRSVAVLVRVLGRPFFGGGRRDRSGRGRRRRGSPPPARALSSAGVPSATSRPPSSRPTSVGELVGLLEVLRGEEDRSRRRPAAPARSATGRAGCAGRARWSARRGRAAAAGSTSVMARSRRRFMPPEYVAARRSAASVRSKRASSSSTRARASALGRWARSAISRRFSRPVEQLVDRGELPGDADRPAHAVRLPADVEAGDPGLPRVGGDEGREDADHGGLPGAVRAQQGVDGADGHGEVDAAEHVDVGVRLRQSGDLDRSGVVGHASSVQG